MYSPQKLLLPKKDYEWSWGFLQVGPERNYHFDVFRRNFAVWPTNFRDLLRQ